MSYLKYQIGRGTTYDIWFYCMFGDQKAKEQTERAIDYECRNIVDWNKPYREIDRENDIPKGLRDTKQRCYYHWIIAPAPENFVDNTTEEGLSKVKALTNAYIDEYAADHQVFVAYHNDAKCKNIHAHIVVGAKNLKTGKKFRFNNSTFEKMKEFVNTKSKEFGLSARLELETHNKEVISEFERLNNERVLNHEQKVLSEDISETQTLRVKYVTNRERHISSQQGTWKDEIRVCADRALLSASSFEEYQNYLMQDGIEVYQNKYKQCIYVIHDKDGRTKGKVKGEKLGKFYQADFLATQYMDLKFTKAFWALHKGEYSYLKETNTRLLNVDATSIDNSLKVYEEHGVLTDADAQRRISAYLNLLSKNRQEKSEIEKDIKKRIQNISDLEYVQSLSEAEKKSNPEYEKIRKRLVRNNIDFSTDVFDLKKDLKPLKDNLDQIDHDIEATEDFAEGLIKAYTTLQSLKTNFEFESNKEKARYRNRIAKRESYYSKKNVPYSFGSSYKKRAKRNQQSNRTRNGTKSIKYFDQKDPKQK